MRAKILTGLLSAGLLLLVTVHPTAQSPASTERKLLLSFDRNGLVSLVAQNVTVREILAEWTRQGTHSEIGPYPVEKWLEIYAAHAHGHADQIRVAREAGRRNVNG